MSELIKLEMKKLYKSSITRITLLGSILFIIFLMLFASTYEGYCANERPITSEERARISKAKENMNSFAGYINDIWANNIFAQEEEQIQLLLQNPDNLMSDEEKQQIYGSQEITDSRMLIRNELYNKYLDKYESVHFWSNYYERAENTRQVIIETERNRYSGSALLKAEDLINQMFDNIQKHEAYYDYNYGWHRLRNVHEFFSYSLIIAVLAGLAPLFASEGSYNTESLVLSNKSGRNRDIIAKLIAGFIFAISTWLIYETINLIIVGIFYGFEGGNTVWQDWVVFYAPYLLNNMQFSVVTILTSFMGVIYTSTVIMFISAICNSQYGSIVISAVMLYLVNLILGPSIEGLSPIWMTQGFLMWRSFTVDVILGVAIPRQVVALLFSAVLSVFFVVAAYYIIRRKEISGS